MKKIIPALLATSLLGGCATMNGQGGGPSPQDVVKVVQQIAQNACGFLPLAVTVKDIFAQGQFQSAVEVANAICGAVQSTSPTLVRGKLQRPMVGNVVVRGRYVGR